MIPDEDYTSYKVGENPGFDYDPPNEKKKYMQITIIRPILS